MSRPTPQKTPAFRKLLADLSQGTVLKPLLGSYLHQAEFRGITLEIEAKDTHSLANGPDGWFHPSSHPLWPARLLWFYLTEPQAFPREPLGYMGTLSVTMGKLMHRFIQEALDDLGVMVRPTRADPQEPTVAMLETRSRGHYDGETKVVLPGFPDDPYQLFEFKTRSPLAKMAPDLDLEAFKTKHPGYYAQVQEYLRMTGLRVAIVLMMQMGYPWELREYHIPYDVGFGQGVAVKYRMVLEMAETGEMPPPCCSPRSKEARACPARGVCPVGML